MISKNQDTAEHIHKIKVKIVTKKLNVMSTLRPMLLLQYDNVRYTRAVWVRGGVHVCVNASWCGLCSANHYINTN